jgi:Spy/CpxP family protein refolding chaperone
MPGHERNLARAIGTGALLAAAALVVAMPAPASDTPAPPPSPYAAQATVAIKALTAEEVDDLLAGRGMGFAKAAELNHYPGPRHVLDLGEKLALTPGQRGRTERLFAGVQAAAQELGRRLVTAEAALDALFAAGRADEAAVARQVGEVARLQGELRATHLSAHLEMRRILAPEQVALYDRLRGYAPADAAEPGGAAPAGHDHQHGG